MLFRPVADNLCVVVDTEAMGELTLKGFHRPVPAYNILRLKD